MKTPASRAQPEATRIPRLRCKLQTIADARRELSKIYREGKAGTRDIGDVSRLANVLFIFARLVEGDAIERRLTKLETRQNEKP